MARTSYLRVWLTVFCFLLPAAAFPQSSTSSFRIEVVANGSAIQTFDFDVPLNGGAAFCYAKPGSDDVVLALSVVDRRVHIHGTARHGVIRDTAIEFVLATDAESPALSAEKVEAIGADGTASAARVTVQSTSGPRHRAVAHPGLQKTSNQLIDDAVTTGAISAETGLTYKVFSAFGDSRLPQQYQGDDSSQWESSILTEAVAQFGSLSTTAQNTLAPFFIPPIYPNSWAGSRAGKIAAPLYSTICEPVDQIMWDYVDAPGVPVRVWWFRLGDAAAEANARSVAGTMSGGVYTKLKTLMGRAPVSDGGSSLLSCSGGSDALDIIIHPKVKRAMTVPFLRTSLDCKNAPVYILIPENPPDGIDVTSIHELMHAIQWAVPVKEQCVMNMSWLMEATAEWAQDYVYPPADTGREHRAAPYYLEMTRQPLDFQNEHHEYGAYLFFFYLTRTANSTGADGSLVARIWNATTGQNALEAVNSSIPGGFAQQWPEFALTTWNADWSPVNKYRTWDSLTDIPALSQMESLSANREFSFGANAMEHLSIRYYDFTFNDPNVRTILFANGLTYQLTKEQGPNADYGKLYTTKDTVPSDDKKNIKIQALLRNGGNWTIEKDWADKPYRAFCRDIQNLDEILLIISNSSYDPNSSIQPKAIQPTIFVSDLGCKEYDGKITGQIAASPSNGNVTFTATSDVKFTAVGNASDPPLGQASGFTFNPSGTVKIKPTGNIPGCTVVGGSEAPLTGSSGQLTVFNFVPPGETAFGKYVGWSKDQFGGSWTLNCPGVPAPPLPIPPFPWWQTAEDPKALIQSKAPGKLSEKFTHWDPGSGRIDWSWDLAPKP